MIKAIFLDFDGTILSPITKEVPSSCKEALQKLQEKGILIIVATGRHLSELMEFPFCHDFSFNAYITLNGQYCFNSKETIYSNPLDPQDVKAIYDHIQDDPYPCVFVEKNRQYMNFYTESVKTEYQHLGTSLPPLEDISRALSHDVYQMSPYLNHKQEEELFSRTKHIKIDRWNDDVIDVLPSSGGKDLGIEKVLEYYRLKKDETISFGDATNDIPMLKHTGIGICMGNGKEEVKKVADFVTKEVDQDGIAFALQHFDLL